MSFGFKAQQKPATNHVFVVAVWLSPVPHLADSAGQSSPVIIRIVLDQFSDEFDVPSGDRTASIDKDLFHTFVNTPSG